METNSGLVTAHKVVLKKHVKVREEKRGTAIFDTTNEKVYVINETGADIVKLVLSGKTIGETVSTLAKEYQCGEDAIKNDVVEFVEDLLSKSLVQVASGENR